MSYTQRQQPIIEVAGLRKSFGDNLVLARIDLTVEPGEVFALIGPNGSGKTTMINILSTLVAPDAGQVRVSGFDVVAQGDRVRGVISLTGQYAAVDGLLTGRENLEMMCRLNGLSGRGSKILARELLERFDLVAAADRRTASYSGGMRRRLDIALSLIARPLVLFLDEPTTGLDPRSRNEVWAFVRELAEDGVTVLLTTQYLEEADQLADRVGVIDGGRIVAAGTAAELKQRVGSAQLDVTFGDGATDSIATDGSVESLYDALATLRTDARGVTDVDLRTPTLDDAFLILTGHQAGAAPAVATEASRA